MHDSEQHLWVTHLVWLLAGLGKKAVVVSETPRGGGGGGGMYCMVDMLDEEIASWELFVFLTNLIASGEELSFPCNAWVCADHSSP